jgi:hypothetical protein
MFFFCSWLWEEKLRTHTNARLKGALDLLVLKTLASQGHMHSYAITLKIERQCCNLQAQTDYCMPARLFRLPNRRDGR